MKRSLLSLLASPCCGADLREDPSGVADHIEEGTLRCVSCGRSYPVRDGIPRLLPPSQSDARVAKTRESFAWEWSRYPGALDEDQPVFLEEVQLPPAEFKGKRVLDAGCGMGRYSLVAMSFGAEVVAFDLSDALNRMAEPQRQWPGLHVVQGDLLRMPFKPGIFDIVYSHGVLHHTHSTRAAFKGVVRLLKSGVRLSVWLYGKAGRYGEFSTNPLRPGREWVGKHRFLAWLVVGARHWVSDILRFFTVPLPLSFTYALSYPLAFIGGLPGLKYLTFSAHPDFRVRVHENFDWLSPPFQYHHTKEELCSWCGEEGVEVQKILPHGLVPKPGILGRKK